MRDEDLRRSDVLTGLLLFLVGVGAVTAGARMPRPEAAGPLAAFLISPGAIPILLGAVLAAGGIAILLKGLRDGGLPRAEDLRRAARAALSPAGRRTLTVGGTFAFFVLILIGRLPFWLATFAYLAALMTLLRAARFRVILSVSFATAIGLHLLFGGVMGLPLP